MGLFDFLRSGARNLDPSPAGDSPEEPGITAAATPLTAISSVARRADEPWQTKVRRWLIEGPGFLGYALELKAIVCAMGDWEVQELDRSGRWQPTDDPRENAMLLTYRGVNEDRAELFRQQIMAEESIGEWYLVGIDTDYGPRFRVVHTIQMDFSQADAGWVAIRDNAGLRPGEPGHTLVPTDQIVRIHNPEMGWPDNATSPLRRVIPDIERYIRLTETMKRSAESRLLTNDMFWLPAEATQQYATAGRRRRNWHEDFRIHARKAFEEGQGVEAYAPFTYSTGHEFGPVQRVETGRHIDAQDLEAQMAAMKDIARGMNMPLRSIVESDTGGNHWSDWLLESQFLRTGAQPTGQAALNNLSWAWFRPLYASLQEVGVLDPAVHPETRRIGLNLANVAKNPDESKILLEAYRYGIPSRETVAKRGLGLSESEIMEFPAGVDDFEAWAAFVARPVGGRPGGADAVAGLTGEAPPQFASASSPEPEPVELEQVELTRFDWLSDVDLLDRIADGDE